MVLLDGRVAVISGTVSPRGIGRATAELFVEHGARIVILDFDETTSGSATAELSSGHLGFACDVTKPESCKAAARGAPHRAWIIRPADAGPYRRTSHMTFLKEDVR